MFVRLHIAAWSLLLLVALTAAARPQDEEDLSPAIKDAADKAVDFLLGQQRNGMWYHLGPDHLDNNIGCTSMVGLALMASDPDRCRQALNAAEAAVMANAQKLESTYGIASAIIFLERRKKSIGPLVNKLLNGQTADGAWGYMCTTRNAPSDNSNTHFAVLALLIARRSGSSQGIERSLKAAERYFRTTQGQDGGWIYSRSNADQRTTASMTCVGLLGLAVGLDNTRRNYEVTLRGGASGSRAEAAMEDLMRDMKRFERDAQVQKAKNFLMGQLGRLSANTEHLTYVLWSIERIAFIYGERSFFGDFDWYNAGARVLLRIQKPNGSWNQDFRQEANADTAMALLFLNRVNLLDGLNMEVVVRGADSSLRDTTRPGSTPRRESGPKGTAEEAQALMKELETGAAIGPRLDEIMSKLEIHTHSAYREVLLDVIYDSKFRESYKEKARNSLANRIARLSGEKVAAYLREADPELRWAAAKAAVRGEFRELVPNLIDRLADEDARVAAAAQEVLKVFTKQDHGNNQEAWRNWYEANRNKSDK